MKRPIFILLVIGALASAQSASAQGPSSNAGQRGDELVSRLESREAALSSKLARTPVPQGRGDSDKAIRRHQLRRERQQIQGLIEKLQTGQRVDPADIDRLLGAARR